MGTYSKIMRGRAGLHLALMGLASLAYPQFAFADIGADIATDAIPTTLPAELPASAASTANGQTVYAPEFFTIYQPQTALDMVFRVPGFSIQGGGGGRGFGQANLNVLINGRRPSSKSQSARDILGQITADSVVRIEILDGAALDIPGLSGQVANIVVRAGELSGSWDYAARFEEGTEPQLMDAGVSLNGKRGDISFNANIQSDQFTFSEDGIETFEDGSGLVFEDRAERLQFRRTRPNASLNLTWAPTSGDRVDHIANLNMSGGYGNYNTAVLEDFIATPQGGVTGSSAIASGEDEIEYEIGADYQLPLGPGTFKLIGLYRFEDSDSRFDFQFDALGQAPSLDQFIREDDEGETVIRGEYSVKLAPKHDLQVSLENAFNYLDSTTEVIETGLSGGIDNVRVEEDRLEGNVTHSWAISKAFNLQTSIGAEYSKIDVVTQMIEPREFVRPKGFIQASYTIDPTWSLRYKLERRVGQLPFGDFVSTVNLSDATANSGNDEIVPTQRWVSEFEVERTSQTGLSGTAKLFYIMIEDPIENIIFPDGSEGPGNLDQEEFYGAEIDITWLLDDLGLSGMRLDASAGVFDSKIDDPITNITRRSNRSTKWRADATLRHDIPKTDWAWFFGIENFRDEAFYRRDQIFQNELEPNLYAGIEHKNFFGMNLEIGVNNITDFDFTRERLIFSPDRNGDLVQREFFKRNRGARLSIELSDTF